MPERVRHILSLSGGKDSSALAVFMKGKVADLEYVFCDTDKELPETYQYLERLQAYLGKPIIRLNATGALIIGCRSTGTTFRQVECAGVPEC